MSLRFALALAILVFVATLLAHLPARAVSALLPPTLVCEQPQGTLWHGGCVRVRSGALTLSDLGWSLHPAALLRLRLSADLTSADPRLAGQARVDVERGGTVIVQALQARLPLQNGLDFVPAGFQGSVDVDMATLRLENGALTNLVGTVRASQLRNELLGDLGSFELRFDGGTPIVGQLHDISGPLALQGQIQLNQANGYQLTGTILARASASPQLAQSLQLLGPPDGEGRRSFSLAGTL